MLMRDCTSSSRWCVNGTLTWHCVVGLLGHNMKRRRGWGCAPRSIAFFTRPLVCAMYTTATSTLYELRSAPSAAVLAQNNQTLSACTSTECGCQDPVACHWVQHSASSL